MRYYVNNLLLIMLLPVITLAQPGRSDTTARWKIKDPFALMTAGFYLGDKTGTARSTVSFSPYITFNGRWGYSFHSTISTKNNKWVIPGDIRMLYYPQYTWGLGDDTHQSNKMLITYKYIRVYQTFLRQIKPDLLAGIGYMMDHRFDIDTRQDSISLERFTGYHYGTADNERSFSSGLSANLIYDERKNPAGGNQGMYAAVAYRVNHSFLGSSNGWSSLYVDTRRYISFSRSRQNVLALWAFYWTALSSKVPFLDLPSIGWDPYQQRSGRGIDQNRYRGKSLTYFEGEYRRDITRDGLLGFVAFANMNSISQPFDDGYSTSHLAYGGGLRIKFSKLCKTKLAIDYGRSKGYGGISINLGETF
jgi:hypothetical protein